MRRSDKELVEQRGINAIISRGRVCRIGLVDGLSAYIVPLTYGYDGARSLFFHSAPQGRKIDLVLRTGRASFEIDTVIRFHARDPDVACTWTVDYESVMGEGRISLLEDAGAKENAFRLIMARYAPPNEWDFPAKMLKRTTIIELVIDSVTAKRSPRAVEDR